MDVKRRDGVRLRFNELVHMVFTGEGRDMSWEEHWIRKMQVRKKLWTRQSNGTLWEAASQLLCLFLACRVGTKIQTLLHRVLFS